MTLFLVATNTIIVVSKTENGKKDKLDSIVQP